MAIKIKKEKSLQEQLKKLEDNVSEVMKPVVKLQQKIAEDNRKALAPIVKELEQAQKINLMLNPFSQFKPDGGGLLGDVNTKVNELMEAGLNILFLDNYERIRIVDKIKEKYNGPYQVIEYPQNPEGNPHKRKKPHEKIIVVGADLTIATSGTHAQVSNHAGSAFPLNHNQQGKRCAKPFRELSVRWDGNVAVCCNDWTGIYKCGNVNDYAKIDDLWNNDAFYSARVKLYHGQRDFGPCNGCDNTTIRNGLLPDRMGKQDLPLPDKTTNYFIDKACGGNSYTKAVKPVYDFINLPSDKLI